MLNESYLFHKHTASPSQENYITSYSLMVFKTGATIQWRPCYKCTWHLQGINNTFNLYSYMMVINFCGSELKWKVSKYLGLKDRPFWFIMGLWSKPNIKSSLTKLLMPKFGPNWAGPATNVRLYSDGDNITTSFIERPAPEICNTRIVWWMLQISWPLYYTHTESQLTKGWKQVLFY